MSVNRRAKEPDVSVSEVKRASARSDVRTWVQEQVEGVSEVVVPKLRDQGIAHFKAQPGFIERLMAELLGEMIYEEARRAIAASRGSVVVLGDVVTDREGVSKRAIRLKHSWSVHLEHAGTRHVLLMDMARSDLILAQRERETRGHTELAYAQLWAKLAMILEDGETVKDRFTEDDIEAMYQTIRAERDQGKGN